MIWRFLGDWNEIMWSCGSSLKSTLVLWSISLIAHVLLLLFGENKIFYTCLFYKFPNSKIYIYSDYHNVLITVVIITMQYLFMFIDSELRLNFCCFSPEFCSLPSDIFFCSVLETITLPQVAFNSLILYNDLSILYVLYGEFQLKFQI